MENISVYLNKSGLFQNFIFIYTYNLFEKLKLTFVLIYIFFYHNSMLYMCFGHQFFLLNFLSVVYLKNKDMQAWSERACIFFRNKSAGKKNL